MPDSDLIGTRLSHYRVLEIVGSGGMGVVYRAHDEHLDRDVAIKVLPPSAIENESSRRRFRHEALSLSKLVHPHINTVHDFDSEAGIDFLVMEFVKGRTLASRIAEGPLPEEEAVGLAIQVTEALMAAHEQRIIHRDLKPANIMVTDRGTAKVLDFGLARRFTASEDATRSLSLSITPDLAGTIPYMSPEQLLFQELDARTDVWALGMTLYEMVVGSLPFARKEGASLVQAILNEPVFFPASPAVSARLRSVIQRCLEKDPERRYASAGDLWAALRQLPSPRARSGHPWPVAAGALILMLGAAALWVADPGDWREHMPWGRPKLETLAILPFTNASADPDQAYLADGFTDELIRAASRLAALRVTSRSSTMEFKADRPSSSAIARQLHVDAVLLGSVQRLGDRVSATVDLMQGGNRIWGERYERATGQLAELQNDVVSGLARQLRVADPRREDAQRARSKSTKPEAHEAYLRGRYYFNQFTMDGFHKAVQQYNHAIEIQPDYAAAYAGLADAYYGLSTLEISPQVAMPRVRAAASRAIELDPDLSDAYAARAVVEAFYDWNWPAAESDFKRAVSLNPSNSGAFTNFGYMLVVRGRFAQAKEQLARAHDLDPLSSFVACVQLWPLYEGREYDEAIRAARNVIAVDSSAWNAYQVASQAYAQKKEFLKSYDFGVRATLLRDSHADTSSIFGQLYAEMGRPDMARSRLQRRIDRGAASGVYDFYDIALLYGVLGERDKAFEWLERELPNRDEAIVFLKVDPAADPLRSDPRFQRVLRAMNLAD